MSKINWKTCSPEKVCRGDLDLATAQHDISTDWIAAYRKYFHVDRPIMEASRLRLPFPPPYLVFTNWRHPSDITGSRAQA